MNYSGAHDKFVVALLCLHIIRAIFIVCKTESGCKIQNTRFLKMTKNITIRMDEDLLQKVRHRAVDEHMSASRWIAKVVRDTAEAEHECRGARRRALSRLDRGFHLGGQPLTREQTHER